MILGLKNDFTDCSFFNTKNIVVKEACRFS